MLICIPSRGRSKSIDLLLKRLPEEWRKLRTVIFVPESEAKAYIGKGVLSIETVPDEWRLSRIYQHLGDYCDWAGHKMFIICDDDLTFAMRADRDTTSTVTATMDDMRDLLETMQRRLADGRWSHVGPAAREMQQARGVGTKDKLERENGRLMRFVGWRTDDFQSLEHNRVQVRSDFDRTLQCLRKGRPNLTLGWWQQDQRGTNATGGCSVYRTAQMMSDEAEKLAMLHPGLVRLREKDDKHGSLAKRVDVVISWQKAFQAG